jgi:hypothetical protein
VRAPMARETRGARHPHSVDRAEQIGRPVVAHSTPELRVQAAAIGLDEEELDHHAAEHERTLMREVLALDVREAEFADRGIHTLEGLRGKQEVDVLVRPRGRETEQLLGPAAEDPGVDSCIAQQREDVPNEGEVVLRRHH